MHQFAWLVAISLIWMMWGASWLAAWRWTARTLGSAGAARQSRYRIVNMVGWVMLFVDGTFTTTQQGAVWRPFLPPLWHLPDMAGWAMATLVLAGAALAWSARATLGRLWSVDVTRKQDHHIVDRGPYAVVRHPIYTGLLFGAIATAAAKGTPIAIGGCALMAIGYHLKARVEERFLAAELGADAYADYRRRVPMLIPFGPH